MTRRSQRQSEQEPVGIIISRGSRAEPVPAFWAYIWGPAPESALAENANEGAEPRAA
jgi:hypothetical protein